MRVTSSLMSQNFLRNLSHTQNKVYKYQEQLSSLKEVNRPSDNPLAVSKILDLKSSIVQNREYKNTMEDAIDWTNVQDSALARATDSMSRIRQLMQQAANGTFNTEDRQAIKNEIESEIASMVDSFNGNFGGRYVFAGKNTTEIPFKIKENANGEFNGIAYSGTSSIDGKLSREVARGVEVELNTDGGQLFNQQGINDDIGVFFGKVLTALKEDEPGEINTLLERADKELNNIAGMRGEIGAISNRLKSTKERNESEYLNLRTMLSNKQDVDLAEKFMEYQMENTAYQASLSMGTKILQTNILNYL